MSSPNPKVILWATTAVVASAAVGWMYQKHQQQRKKNDSSTPSSSKDQKEEKKSRSKATTSKVAFDLPRPTTHQEEKKEPEDIIAASSSSIDGRPVPEIALTGEDRGEKLRILSKGVITIVHASVTGTCSKLANKLQESLKASMKKSPYQIQIGHIQDFDWWDEFLNDDEEDSEPASAKAKALLPKLILLIPTYTNGTWPPSSDTLQSTFQELQTDWRIEKFPLKKKIHVGIFGMGSSAYGDNTMGKPAREAQMNLHKLGAKTIVKLMIGDDSVGDHAQTTFQTWTQELIKQIAKFDNPTPDKKKPQSNKKEKNAGTCGEGKPSSECCQNSNNDSATEKEGGACGSEDDVFSNEGYISDDEDEQQETEANVMDLEDMGDVIALSEEKNGIPQEMVTPSQATALKKEGYKLIGTHSAVKLCRWTKHQLRGRGGCYKHTFYGITSYQCMEATPSLACANKCVFCWRHHKNPVGKEWRWKTDDPAYIVDEAVKTHVNMIKETKGIPGVRMDRWKEAHTVRHCALSLVGEPIMYPRIDELLADLHSRKISTFLVTNGQHPVAIESLRPITQLYVSVDAPTQESLIAIDRPLFQDAWDRLKRSLVSLKDKGQRTVARLTVVKGWNSDEISGYAKLVALGKVSLVEVKGVTFCGKSDASNLNMTNTPFHHEVVALTTTLKEELDKLRAEDPSIPEYGLACEHKHSVSVLLARVDQFAVNDPMTGERKWRTWIDYDKFYELAMKNAEDPSFTFSVTDYVADTPSWALMGAEEEGFDPTDTRHRRKKKHPKYTKFDENGIPTHDHNNEEISEEERARLMKLMEDRKNEIGCGTTVTELKDGAKEVHDASNMFRGLTITK